MKNWLALALALLLAIAPAAAKTRKNMPIPLGGGGIPPWVVNPSNPPDFMFDFTGNRAWVNNPPRVTSPASLITTSRASTAYVNDSNGVWTQVPANTPRISNLGLLVEEGRTNSIRNNSMQGAVVQADSVELLTNGNFAAAGSGWTTNTSGGTVVITAGQAALTGTGSGILNYISQQVSGLTVGRNYVFMIATSNSTGLNLSVGNSAGDTTLVNATSVVSNSFNSASPDRVGFTATATSHWITVSKVQAGTANVTSVSVQDGERVQNGGFTANPVNASASTIQNGWQWSLNTGTGTVTYGSNAVTVTGDGTNTSLIGASLPTISGCTYTISIDVTTNVTSIRAGTSFQSSSLLSVNSAVGTGQKFQFTATGTTTWIGFGRSSATPSTISNVSVVSAGALPTNWSLSTNAGLVSTVNTIGTENGIDYIDLQFNGTTTATSLQLWEETAAGIAASAAQVWSHSAFFKLVGGALTNVTGNGLGVSFIGGSGGADQSFTPDGTLARVQQVAQTAGASTTNIRPYWKPSFNNASAVNFTIRIGWPQLELGASVTSPIRTTTVAVTRSADVVSLTSPPAFGAAYSMYAKGTPQMATPAATFQAILELTAGTSANRAALRRTTAGVAQFSLAGGTGVSLGATSWAQNTSRKMAAAAAAADQASCFNGGAADTGTAASLPTTPAVVYVGSSVNLVSYFNGFVEAAAMWTSTRVPNAELQSITTP